MSSLYNSMDDMKISDNLLDIISRGEPSMETYEMMNRYELTNIDINGMLHDSNYYNYKEYGIPDRIQNILDNIFNDNWIIMKGMYGIYISNKENKYITSTPTELVEMTMRDNSITSSYINKIELCLLSEMEIGRAHV